MPLNNRQIERVRVLTGHLRLDLRPVKGWDEDIIEDYLAMIDELESRLAGSYDEFTDAQRNRQRGRLCNILGVHPGPEFPVG